MLQIHVQYTNLSYIHQDTITDKKILLKTTN